MFNVNSNLEKPGVNRLIQRCETLARITSKKGAISRAYLSEEHQNCLDTISLWMKSASIQTRTDALGNLWGRLVAKDESAPSIVLGAHLDASNSHCLYDGVLGILAAIEVVEQIREIDNKLPYHIDLVGFGDGATKSFGIPSICSKSIIGKWQDSWLDLKDEREMSLRSALENFGLAPELISEVNRSKDKILAYFELHAEKGPVLAVQKQPLGVASSIAGNSQVEFVFEGESGHTGNIPMSERKDPLIAASIAIQEIERLASQARVVANVGNLNVYPGEPHLIAQKCNFILDIRSGQDISRELALGKIIGETHVMCDHRGIKFRHHALEDSKAVRCSSRVQRQIEEIIVELGLDPVSMVSGVERQAKVFKGITDIGVLFIRGPSHAELGTHTALEKSDLNNMLNVLSELLVRQ